MLGNATPLSSATTTAAEVPGLPDKLGRIAPGAFADMLVVDGDPLRDITCLLGQGERIPLVLKGGEIYFDQM